MLINADEHKMLIRVHRRSSAAIFSWLRLHGAAQPALPDGAGTGRKAVAAREKLELHIITTKTQTARVLFRSFGQVELVVSARDVQHGGAEWGGAGERTEQ